MKGGKKMRVVGIVIFLLVVILGVHGLYVHFAPSSFLNQVIASSGKSDGIFGVLSLGDREAGMLFGFYRPPGVLGSIVQQVTFWGLESWFLPAALTVGGYILLRKVW